MSQIASFEDLIAWQKARALTRRVYDVTRKGPFARDFGLADQIRRSSVSVMANVAEGFERKRAAEFLNFLAFAKGSCAEVVSHLYVALDAGYIEEAEFKELRSSALEVGRVIAGLAASVKRGRSPDHAGNSVLGTRYSVLP